MLTVGELNTGNQSELLWLSPVRLSASRNEWHNLLGKIFAWFSIWKKSWFTLPECCRALDGLIRTLQRVCDTWRLNPQICDSWIILRREAAIRITFHLNFCVVFLFLQVKLIVMGCVVSPHTSVPHHHTTLFSICGNLYISFLMLHRKKLFSVLSDRIISEISWVWEILYCKFIPQLLLSFTLSSPFQMTKSLPQNLALLGD